MINPTEELFISQYMCEFKPDERFNKLLELFKDHYKKKTDEMDNSLYLKHRKSFIDLCHSKGFSDKEIRESKIYCSKYIC